MQGRFNTRTQDNYRWMDAGKINNQNQESMEVRKQWMLHNGGSPRLKMIESLRRKTVQQD